MPRRVALRPLFAPCCNIGAPCVASQRNTGLNLRAWRPTDRRRARAASHTLRDQRKIAAPGFRPRQAGHTRQLAGNRHAGAGQKASGDLPQCRLTIHAPAQLVGKPIDAERPDVGELRRIDGGRRNHDHRGLQLVQRSHERRAILDAGLVAQGPPCPSPILCGALSESARACVLRRRSSSDRRGPRRRGNTESCAAQETSAGRGPAWRNTPCRAP